MILKNETLDERCLEIYEEDRVNNSQILILKVYGIRRNSGLWEFPQPQIFNDTIYNNYKNEYDEKILSFRNDCENLTSDKGSILQSQITTLSNENAIMMKAIDELCQMILQSETPSPSTP